MAGLVTCTLACRAQTTRQDAPGVRPVRDAILTVNKTFVLPLEPPVKEDFSRRNMPGTGSCAWLLAPPFARELPAPPSRDRSCLPSKGLDSLSKVCLAEAGCLGMAARCLPEFDRAFAAGDPQG